jgi:hypothetical protein
VGEPVLLLADQKAGIAPALPGLLIVPAGLRHLGPSLSAIAVLLFVRLQNPLDVGL